MLLVNAKAADEPLKLLMDARPREVPFQMPESYNDFYGQFTTNSRSRLEIRVRDLENPIRVRIEDMHDPTLPIVGKGQVIGSMKTALREIVVDTSFVQDSQDWFRDLVEGAIGNTEEEEITVAKGPMLQYSEATWRQETTHKVKWGIRPLRWPDPYVYVSGRLGHYEGEDIFVWHVRYHLHKFTGQRVEMLVSKPLPEKFYLTSGIIYATDKDFRNAGHVYLGTLRIEKWFTEDRGAVFAGVEFDNKLNLVAGYYYAF